MHNVCIKQNNSMSIVQRVFCFLYMFVLIFDPADRIFKLKMPLFIIIFALALFDFIFNKKIIRKEIFVICTVFIGMTLMSIMIGSILKIDFNSSFAISKIKSIMGLFLIFVFAIYEDDFIKLFVQVLNILIVVIIILFFIDALGFASLRDWLYDFGNKMQSFTINHRMYGDVNFASIYFHSSPYLVLSVGYYANRLCNEIVANKEKKLNDRIIVSCFWSIITVLAMFLTGTRNNMFFSLIIIMAIIFYKSKNKLAVFYIYLALLLMLLMLFGDVIFGMLDFTESSNNTKIQTIYEYNEFFNQNQIVLLLGQGIGGSIYSKVRGGYVEITELTYLDIIRWWGVFGGIFVIALMFLPIVYIYIAKKTDYNWLIFAYGAFLIMIALNPFFFNSVGMLLYALVFEQAVRVKKDFSKSKATMYMHW